MSDGSRIKSMELHRRPFFALRERHGVLFRSISCSSNKRDCFFCSPWLLFLCETRDPTYLQQRSSDFSACTHGERFRTHRFPGAWRFPAYARKPRLRNHRSPSGARFWAAVPSLLPKYSFIRIPRGGSIQRSSHQDPVAACRSISLTRYPRHLVCSQTRPSDPPGSLTLTGRLHTPIL